MQMARELYLKGESPGHHLFGVNELIETKKYNVEYLLISPKNYNNKILKLFSLIPMWIKMYYKASKYDIVYGAADFTVDFLGIMKKIRLFKPTLITIFHHPPFNLRMKIAQYNHIIYLGHDAAQKAKQKVPKKNKNISFLQWGPDLTFYRNNVKTPNYIKSQEHAISFISNGKTKRDHEIFVSAIEDLKIDGLIVSDKNSIPSNYNKKDCLYTKIFYQDKPNDKTMVHLLNKYSVLVIPTYKSKNLLGPIGLTSFLDAIALGMPMITADNTVFAKIIEDNKLGLVYEAGNLNSLEKAMNTFINDRSLIYQLGENAYKFGLENNISNFGLELDKIIELYNKK